MKKHTLTAALAAIILAVSATACDTKSADSNESKSNAAASSELTTTAPEAAATTEATTTTTQAAPQALATSYADSYTKRFADLAGDGKEVTMDCTMKMSLLGMELNYDMYITYSMNKNKLYSKAKVDAMGETMDVTMLWDGDKYYTFDETKKQYYISPETFNMKDYLDEMNVNVVDSSLQLALVDTQKATVDGKACVKEVFSNETPGQLETEMKYCYTFEEATGALVSVSMQQEGIDVVTMNFKDYKSGCDESKFVVPDLSGYTKSETEISAL